MGYSLDFRKHVFATKKKFNLSFEETSERFNVSMRSLFRWQNKIEPCTTRNKPATKINMDQLAKDVELYPDAYHYERAERLGVATSTVCDALKRLNLSRKKNSKTPKSK